MRTLLLIAILCLAMLARCASAQLAEPDDTRVDPGDWPMLARDARRSGYTPIGFEGPFTTPWRWFNERPYAIDEQPPEFNEVLFHMNVQPVIVEGLLYIGAMNGRLYAIRTDNGQLAWMAQTGRQITQSACVYGANVIVNCTDGKVYAFDRKTGKPAWTVQTGAPLYSAPVAGGGRIYVAGRDGFVYGIERHDGAVAWKSPIGDQSQTSPAYDGGVVYVGAENAVAYAIDARDGRTIWQTQLPGSSMRHSWPVVASDAVIFRTIPPHGSDVLFGAMEQILRANAQIPWAELQEKIRQFLTDNPEHQTFFVLDRQTGRQRFVAPVGAIMRHQDTPTASVLAPGDLLYVNFRNNHTSSVKTGSFGTNFCPDFGILDLKTGNIRTFAPTATFGGVIEQSLDDPSAFSMAGDWLIGSHQNHPGGKIGKINVKDHRQAQVVPRWNYDQQPYPGGWSGPETLYRRGQRVPNTVMGFNANIGMGYGPPAIVNGVLYTTHVSGSALVAIQGKAVR